MDNTADVDRKRLATIDERDPTTASLRATRKRTSKSAGAAPSASPQADPPNPPEAPGATPALKARPADPEFIPAAAKDESAAPGVLNMVAPLSASVSKLSVHAAPSPPPARAAVAGETDVLRARFPIPDAEALVRNMGQAM